MKAWLIDEAEKHGVSKEAIAMRIHRGKYPGLKLHRVNKRVIYVLENDPRNESCTTTA